MTTTSRRRGTLVMVAMLVGTLLLGITPAVGLERISPRGKPIRGAVFGELCQTMTSGGEVGASARMRELDRSGVRRLKMRWLLDDLDDDQSAPVRTKTKRSVRFADTRADRSLERSHTFGELPPGRYQLRVRLIWVRPGRDWRRTVRLPICDLSAPPGEEPDGAPPPPGESSGGDGLPPAPPDGESDPMGDPTSAAPGTGTGDTPTDDGSGYEYIPAVAGSGGDPAEELPELGDFTTADSDAGFPMPVVQQRDFSASIFYEGQPTFSLHSSGYLGYDNLPTQVGRLYSYVGGQVGGTCSGTVVAANMVLTAAHCVKGADCFRFYPDLYGTQARYGAWDSCRAWYPTYYDTLNQYAYDYALITLQPNASGSIGDVVGTKAVLMDTAHLVMDKYNMGYPGEGWFAANCSVESCYPYFCYSPQGAAIDWGNGFGSTGWGCNANGGISGGPVFAAWNGRWYVVSVNSTGGGIVPCPSACSSSRNSYYMVNMWGPGFTSGAFDAFWNEVMAFG